MKKLTVLALLLIVVCTIQGQNTDIYNVYAIKIRENGKFPAVNLRFIPPDIALQKLNISPSEITDIILTHPHFDHIGGIHLFPNAVIWIQKNDFNYFVGEAWQENGFSDGFNKDDGLKLIEGDDLEIIPGIKVFIGSKHTFENQYVLVNTNSVSDKILIASDAIWFYYNLNNLLPIQHYVFDSKAYVNAMKRMKTLVDNQDMIIPGHDDLLFLKFPEIKEWIVKIEN